VGAPNGATGGPSQNLLDRSAALDKLLDSTTSDDIPASIQTKLSDFDENKYKRGNAASVGLGKKMAGLNVGDTATLDRILRDTQADMTRVVEEIKTALAKQMPQDGWLTKDAFAKVNFRDEAKDGASFRLQPEDDFWSKRLRSQFMRVLGKRKYSLHDTGSVIDVSAYIEGLLSYEPVPCFHTEDLGRGFKALVLLDRSNSMSGEKTAQAERACRILLKSLDFPFVDLHVWGFQSKSGGEVDITRFHKSAPNFTKTTAKVGGTTPLHTALRLARRFLEEGTDAKLLIPVTDGFPCHTSKKGFQYSTRALLNFSRSEVLQAKASGVKIGSVIIGNDLRDFQLNHLFGSRNWKRVGSSDVGRALVQVITSGFIHYLLRG
jgi:Mg-chelatase subunit ChlD